MHVFTMLTLTFAMITGNHNGSVLQFARLLQFINRTTSLPVCRGKLGVVGAFAELWVELFRMRMIRIMSIIKMRRAKRRRIIMLAAVSSVTEWTNLRCIVHSENVAFCQPRFGDLTGHRKSSGNLDSGRTSLAASTAP